MKKLLMARGAKMHTPVRHSPVYHDDAAQMPASGVRLDTAHANGRLSVHIVPTMRMKYISRQNSEIDVHSKRDEQQPTMKTPKEYDPTQLLPRLLPCTPRLHLRVRVMPRRRARRVRHRRRAVRCGVPLRARCGIPLRARRRRRRGRWGPRVHLHLWLRLVRLW